jgi:hypothetical protein
MGGGSTSASSNVKVDSDSTSSVDILGLDDLNADFTLHLPQPISTESKNTNTSATTLDVRPLSTTSKSDSSTDTHLTVDPLRTDTNLSVDVKPAVVDLCLTMNVGKVPNVCIRQPYHHHIGLTLYGTELWGMTFSGEQQTVIDELDKQPKVAWGGATTTWPPSPPTAAPPPTSPRAAPPQPATRQSGGLRIRLGG